MLTFLERPYAQGLKLLSNSFVGVGFAWSFQVVPAILNQK